MFRSFSYLQAGGTIPRCYGFRIRPRLLSGQTPGTGPWPVTVRHTGQRKEGDLIIFDPTFYTRVKNRDGESGPPLGPYIIDPDNAHPAWGWDVTVADDPGEILQPAPDGADAGLGGAIRVAKRGRVAFDSGIVAGGAAIDSGVLDLCDAEQLLLIIDNTGTGATRALRAVFYHDDGVTIVMPSTLLRTVAVASREFYAMGPGVGTAGVAACMTATPPTRAKFTLDSVGGGGNGRVTIYKR